MRTRFKLTWRQRAHEKLTVWTSITRRYIKHQREIYSRTLENIQRFAVKLSEGKRQDASCGGQI